MAITVNQIRKLNSIRVISVRDGALDKDDPEFKEKWERYQQDPQKHESLLKFKPEMQPTVFVCNFEFTGKEQANIKDAMLKGFDVDDNSPKISMGRWAYMVAKYAIKDIQNPPNVKDTITFRKDGRGYVHDDTMTFLERLGIAQEILQVYNNLIEPDKDEVANSKN